MKQKNFGKKVLSALLAAAMTFSVASSTAVGSVSAKEADAGSFAQQLESKYVDPDRVFGSDVRWWLGDASLTDEALLEEIQAMYDYGFRGVELCMQDDRNAPNETYAYGSEMWSHKWKLMMNKLLDLGMTVSLTSGTNWATSNVPGLDPDSQQASQVIAMGKTFVQGGETVTALPKPDTTRASNKGQFIGAYAYKKVSERGGYRPSGVSHTKPQVYTINGLDYDSIIDLSKETSFTEGATVYDQAVNWTAPDDGEWMIVAYWTHGNYVTASPAAETCYAINYFDDCGVEALRDFWEANYLNDPELNEKIKNGDVQLFMDSIEINPTGGITWWSEGMRDEFIARKGYDPMPYLLVVEGLPQIFALFNPYVEPAEGFNEFDGMSSFNEKVVNDWVDVLTELYSENLLGALKNWLNPLGIKTRAQISYGRSFEISKPIAYVDYPEGESLNMQDNIDIFRLLSGGAKLQNKVLSSETGGEAKVDAMTPQNRLRMVYPEYAVGYQRVVWHIWSALDCYGEKSAWPGWGNSYDRIGRREANARDFDEFNAHVGRLQQLLQTGKARSDIGFIHSNWNQGTKNGRQCENTFLSMNWMLAHQGVYYRSTELQDNGYSYDYFSPDLLKAEGVYFNEETKTVELAGYKALVIYQNWLDYDGAQLILDWAKKGLPVFIMEHAAQRTPFNDGKDEDLAKVMNEMRTLDNVVDVEIYDDSEGFDYFKPIAEGYDDGLYDALQEMGIRPYAGYVEPNHQLLTQMREDEDGNRYLYAYNYCSNEYHSYSSIESVRNEDHGTNIQTEMQVDGLYIPYQIDAWSGEVTEIGNYRYEDGQTIFPIDLDYNNVALFAFEKVDEEPAHITHTNADSAYVTKDGMVIRAAKSGSYYAVTNDGSLYNYKFDVPAPYDITNWDLTVESWTAGDEKIYKEETIGDVHTVNSRVSTAKMSIQAQLDKLTTWDNIPEVGKNISGLGHYEATFNWDASKADGAYLDFGDEFVSSMKIWINGRKVGGDVSQNPTKAPTSILQGYDDDYAGVAQYTGGVCWTKPIVDISEYLVDGENSIVLEYSSTITNAQLARGAIKESISEVKWGIIDTYYFSYGPSQAVVVPFVEETIAAAEAEPVKSASAPASAQVGAAFDVTVVTAGSVTDVRLFNENDMAIGRKAVNVIENEDGTKTWTITVAIGTVGNDRTLKVVTKGAESYLVNSGKTVSLDITSIPPVLNSFDIPDSAVVNRTFIVHATTDMAATKIAVYNEYGVKMGLKSLSYKIVDGQKEWTAVMSIGTKGERTFTAYAVNKFGVQSDALTDNISVRAFA